MSHCTLTIWKKTPCSVRMCAVMATTSAKTLIAANPRPPTMGTFSWRNKTVAVKAPWYVSNVVVETAALVLAGRAWYSRIATVLALLWFYSVAFVTWTNQPINQPTNQPIHPSINQSINQSINRSINQSIISSLASHSKLVTYSSQIIYSVW